ncbi:MAG: hypothetical protein K6F87_02415 [Lachnospiraceae bacterium]|nr:hypothetical protein [Lachnospiraceae bacterium]
MQTCRLIRNCILAAIPAIALIAFTLLCPSCYMDEEYEAWAHARRTAEGKEYKGQDFDTVILGDSGAMSSIMPQNLNGSCVNLAVGGATSIEMYYFLEEYLKNHDAPERVIIMFAPFHYWHIDNYKTRTVYFKAIPLDKICGLYDNARRCEASSVLYDGVEADEISARCGLPNKYLPAINASKFIGRYADNKKTYADLTASFGYGGFGELDECHDMSYETSYDDMVIDGDAKLITLYMQKLLKMCEDNGIHVRLLQPAVNTETFEGLNEHYYAAYKNHIKRISTVIDDIECETQLRVYDGKYFSDASHLNPKGAKRFTEEIKEKYDE